MVTATSRPDKFVLSAMENWKTADGQDGRPAVADERLGHLVQRGRVQGRRPAGAEGRWTWDEMYAAAAKLTGKNGAKYGLVADPLTALDGPFTMSTYSVSAGGAPFTDNVNHLDQGRGGRQVHRGRAETGRRDQGRIGRASGYDVSNVQGLLAAGKVPMMFGGSGWPPGSRPTS